MQGANHLPPVILREQARGIEPRRNAEDIVGLEKLLIDGPVAAPRGCGDLLRAAIPWRIACCANRRWNARLTKPCRNGSFLSKSQDLGGLGVTGISAWRCSGMELVILFNTRSDLASDAITYVHCLTKQLEAIHNRLFGEQVRSGAAFDVDLTCRWSHRS